MPPSTRSRTTSPIKRRATPTPISPSKQDPPMQHAPLHLLVVPRALSPQARILTLPSPHDGSPKRFLFWPTKGLFEFTRVAAPQSDFRSILFASSEKDVPARVEETGKGTPISSGYVQKEAAFLVATPFDIVFLLLSLLPNTMTQAAKVLFQPIDDLFESHVAENAHLSYLIQHGKHILEKALVRICDTIDAGDEQMFRVNENLVQKLLLDKAERMICTGLPRSMEEKFVHKALEPPVLSIKREETVVSTVTRENTIETETDSQPESFDSSSTAVSSAAPSVFSEVSVASAATTVVPQPISSEIFQSMRRKVSIDFLLASYFSPTMAGHLRAKTMADPSFAPLIEHLKQLALLRAEALASRSLGDFSRKRGQADDDEAAEDRAEKKRKLEEDEKRKKANLSRGVRDLGKVNVTGMKKMSDFFSKKPVIGKART